MITKIQRWGNSLGLRIPKAFAVEAQVEAGSTVDISVGNGGLFVRPVRRRRCTLSELLRGVTAQNIHDPIDTGRPVGREVW